MKGILVLCLLFLTSCDYLNQLKFKYYYSYKGEVLCIINEEVGLVSASKMGQSIHIKSLNSDRPEITYPDGKVSLFNKLWENEKITNLQKLDPDTGRSEIIFLNKESGSIFYSDIGYNENEINYSNSRANCK